MLHLMCTNTTNGNYLSNKGLLVALSYTKLGKTLSSMEILYSFPKQLYAIIVGVKKIITPLQLKNNTISNDTFFTHTLKLLKDYELYSEFGFT